MYLPVWFISCTCIFVRVVCYLFDEVSNVVYHPILTHICSRPFSSPLPSLVSMLYHVLTTPYSPYSLSSLHPTPSQPYSRSPTPIDYMCQLHPSPIHQSHWFICVYYTPLQLIPTPYSHSSVPIDYMVYP